MARSVSVDSGDDALLRAIREGDERVFGDLVKRWSGMMLRLALSHIESRAIAEWRYSRALTVGAAYMPKPGGFLS